MDLIGNQMPEEVLEHIFLHLPDSMMSKLTLVCTRFNNLISSSTKLLKKFPVMWSEEKQPFECSRSYRKMEIHGVNQTIDNFLTSNNIRIISLFQTMISLDHLEEILRLTANSLKEIHISFTRIEVEVCEIFERVPMELPNLKKLSMFEMGQFATMIPLFSKASLTHLSLYNIGSFTEKTAIDENKFIEFMKTQPTLTNVILSAAFTSYLFRDSANESAYPFKLKKFNGMGQLVDATNPNTIDFFTSQGKSLNHIDIYGMLMTDGLVRLFMQMQLKQLRFRSCGLNCAEKVPLNSSIEILHLDGLDLRGSFKFPVDYVCDLMRSCRNLKTLELGSFQIPFEMTMVLVYDLSLDTLSFYECNFMPVCYPSIKTLELKYFRYDNRHSQLIRLNRYLPGIRIAIPHSGKNGVEELLPAIKEALIRDVSYPKMMHQ